jgi:hypothetical protein
MYHLKLTAQSVFLNYSEINVSQGTHNRRKIYLQTFYEYSGKQIMSKKIWAGISISFLC